MTDSSTTKRTARANRLASETSPYLLQHANNPVDWFPWGAEALQKARDEDKPIFLSIGYSACHWCHVMEHESFEDESIARVLNENFVSIKVDREERPDLDQIYMNAVMALRGGGGGWPLSVFLTPTQEVFFGGTYWPPKSRLGMPGFDQVLHGVLDAYSSRRDQVTTQSKRITDWLNENEVAASVEKPGRDLLANAAEVLTQSFDYENGGFGGAPKFPHAMDLRLLTLLSRTWNPDDPPGREGLLEMVRINCKKMAYGGIFDHLAGGFARYAVDEKWLVPHFEKMLYDNALLADVYLEMFAATRDDFYSGIARKTLDYMLGYLTDGAGAFYSSEDADSEGEEGKFYVWSKQEIHDILGPEIGRRFCELYNVTAAGNFEGHNILNMTVSFQQFADQAGMDKQDLRAEMRTARKKLLEVRDRRIRPGLDDKVLVSWNALAIHALARAGVILDEPKYGGAAAQAAEFIWQNLRKEDGRLLHTWRNGQAKLDAYLDDYAYLILALLEVYQFDFDVRWVDRAANLVEQMVSHFWDEEFGGFFFTADDHEQLIARSKVFQDSSTPSGNAMATSSLVRLGRLTGRTDWLEIAERTMSASLSLIKRSPLASGQMLIAIEQYLDDAQEFVLVAENEADIAAPLAALRKSWNPSSQVICQSGQPENTSGALANVLDGKVAIDNRVTLYTCDATGCQAPVVGVEEILAAMKSRPGV